MSDKPESLAAALAELQQHLPRIGKDKTARVTSQRTGKTHTYDYANLASVSREILPMLGELGLSFSACPTMDNERFVLDYALRFAGADGSHECLSGQYPLPSSGSPQEIGSAITYARRYCLLAVTGAAPDDDDDDAQAAEAEYRALRNSPPEVREDGSATEAEQARMVTGPEPGVERLGTTPVDDPWLDEPGQPLNPPPEEEWGSVGPEQLTRMFAMFAVLKMREREAQVDFIESVIGERVQSRRDLSRVQAGRVLQALEERSRADV